MPTELGFLSAWKGSNGRWAPPHHTTGGQHGPALRTKTSQGRDLPAEKRRLVVSYCRTIRKFGRENRPSPRNMLIEGGFWASSASVAVPVFSGAESHHCSLCYGRESSPVPCRPGSIRTTVCFFPALAADMTPFIGTRTGHRALFPLHRGRHSVSIAVMTQTCVQKACKPASLQA